jgi:hypothetical protein
MIYDAIGGEAGKASRNNSVIHVIA